MVSWEFKEMYITQTGSSKTYLETLSAVLFLLPLSSVALEKMFQVYSANPSLGDKNVVQQQLGKIREKLDALNNELYKFEVSCSKKGGQL